MNMITGPYTFKEKISCFEDSNAKIRNEIVISPGIYWLHGIIEGFDKSQTVILLRKDNSFLIMRLIIRTHFGSTEFNRYFIGARQS